MSQQEKSNHKNTDDDWELSSRSSCEYCLEPYDATDVIPRNLSCGHSCCEGCIERSRTSNVFTCVCKVSTVVANVKDLPLNRPILAISDFLNDMQAKKRLNKRCGECGADADQKFFAVCKSGGCAKFQQLICLWCVNNTHKDHATSSFEDYIREIRGECRSKLERQQEDLRMLFREVRTTAVDVVRRIDVIEKNLKENPSNRLILEQTSTLLDEKEAEELLEIGASLLDPFHSELQNTNDNLKSVLESLELTFGDGSRGDAELSSGGERIAPAVEEKGVILMDLSKFHTLRVIECTEVRENDRVYYKLRLSLPSASHELRLLPGQFLISHPSGPFLYPTFPIVDKGHVHFLTYEPIRSHNIVVAGHERIFVYEGGGVSRTLAEHSKEWERRCFKRIVLVIHEETPAQYLRDLSFIEGLMGIDDETCVDIICCAGRGGSRYNTAAKNPSRARLFQLAHNTVKQMSTCFSRFEDADGSTAFLISGEFDEAVFADCNPSNRFSMNLTTDIR